MATNLTETDFHSTLAETEGVSVVQFTAPWCGPCRMLAPRLAELADDLSVNYFKVDIDDNGALAREFTIMSVPTLQWYKNGELVKTTVGIKSYVELKQIVEEL